MCSVNGDPNFSIVTAPVSYDETKSPVDLKRFSAGLVAHGSKSGALPFGIHSIQFKSVWGEAPRKDGPIGPYWVSWPLLGVTT